VPVFLPPASAGTGGGSGEVAFSWKALSGADHYDVYWSVFPGGSKTKLATVSEAIDQFGAPWGGDTRTYIDGLPPAPLRHLVSGQNCYFALMFTSSAPATPAIATGEKCFSP